MKSLFATALLVAPALASAASFTYRIPATGVRGGEIALHLSAADVNFEVVDVGDIETSTLVLTNSGARTATNLSFAELAPPFAVTSDCGTSLPGGASCNLSVTYSPQSSGGQSELLSVESEGTVASATLYGTGHFQVKTISVAAGDPDAMLLTADGTMWQTGEGSYPGFASRSVFKPVMTGVKQIAAGSHMSLVSKIDGSLWTAGQANYGATGTGKTYSPGYRQTNLSNVTGISGHYVASVAMDYSGYVYFSGNNMYGMRGNGSDYASGSTSTFAGTGLSNVKQLVSNNSNVLALKNNGTLWGAGSNDLGQLPGAVKGTNVTTFTQIATGVKTIGINYESTILVRTDGTLWMAGRNSSGMFGNGTTTGSTSFVQILGMSGVKSVVGTGYSTYVLKEDGTVWASGDNQYGQLGVGNTVLQTTFVKVFEGAAKLMEPGNTSAVTFIIDNNGKLWAAGRGGAGGTGLGTTSDALTFQRVRF